MRSRLVDRGPLIDKLSTGSHHKLTLVSAPAGWGKTTLLTQWVAREGLGVRFGWLTLDDSDNDPTRFWSCVIAALRRTDPEIASRAVEFIGLGADLTLVVLPTLLNELAAHPGRIVLILDDYHLVESREVHAQVAFFVERVPENIRLVVATRSDPVLPLARLRARGDLLEIRTGDLRFAVAEAAGLVTEVLGPDVSDAEIELLVRRTEGWAAGLYLAALSVVGRADPATFIRSFAGDHRHVVDYLIEEVLAGQSEERRRFLLRTSVPSRLSGALCDAMLLTTNSPLVLEEIERANLFLVPLDASRHWYRYHQLFAELLRAELNRVEPELVPILHRRAADWFVTEGLIDDAVHHLAAAGDVARSAEVIATHWVSEFSRGRLSTVRGWLQLLPTDVVASDTRLTVARAWIELNLGDVDAGGFWIDALDAALPDDSDAHDPMASQLRVLRAVHHFKTGDVTAAIHVASQAIALEREEAPQGASGEYCIGAHCAFGAAMYFSDGIDEAREAFRIAVRLAEMVADHRARIYALGYLAVISAEDGALDDAREHVDSVAGGDVDFVSGDQFVGLMVSLATALLLARRGSWSDAVAASEVAVISARQGGGVLEVAKALVVRADVLDALGDRDAARVSRKEAAGLLAGASVTGIDGTRLADAVKRSGGTAARAAPGDGLTDREREILLLLDTGLSRREIGERLFVSLNTVKTHQRILYRKLGVGSRTAAIGRARELGLIR